MVMKSQKGMSHQEAEIFTEIASLNYNIVSVDFSVLSDKHYLYHF